MNFPAHSIVSPLRLPPANLEAEQALLGGLLANNKAYDRLGGQLEARHFADEVHGKIFEVIRLRIESGRLADAVTVSQDFEGNHELDDAGGPAYVRRLLGSMVSIIGVGEYAREIRELWLRREIIDKCAAAAEAAFSNDPQLSAPAILSGLDSDLADLSRDGSGGGEARDSATVAREVMENFDAAAARKGGLAGITTGYAGFDRMTGGMMGGQLILCGARPAMGKTALSLGIATRSAAAGSRIFYASAEMLAKQVLARAVASASGQPITAALRAGCEDEQGNWQPLARSGNEARALAMAARRIGALPIHWDDSSRQTAASIRQKARLMKRRVGLDAIVVDYLGRMQPSQRASGFKNRTIEIGELARDLKYLAMELEVPVFLLSQLSRGVETRDSKRPTLSDLRDSGEIEQEADIVTFLYREHYYLLQDKPERKAKEGAEAWNERLDAWGRAVEAAEGKAELIIAKQRQGPVGPVRLRFDGPSTWFFNDQPRDEAREPAIPGLPE
ncbi:replicative DNA helicase [Roseococcus pinisoli]|uniref:DNA 5'-3' helicase n=1 Tax=Roseococcus pinisoli TaxID=2835040 RepID=A0ABS5QA33_9PROT|nr:DnaB-like helicase C-terminal domain-containing protein [Roseococcus pinisoli]MBS7810520.1 replicative DNA helicase [Roseococcus pinisoli]